MHKFIGIVFLASLGLCSKIAATNSLANHNPPTADSTYSSPSVILYNSIDFAGAEKPDLEMFTRGINGYNMLRNSRKLSDKEIIALIDFRKSANEKRLWIIDLKNNRLLKYTLVAHGRNSGDVYATKFSNTPNSNQSSLGFYITGSVYTGKHGTSLILYGAESGINDNAEKRAIVMHAANYVSEAYVKKVGRLGRSFGCPAVSVEEHKEIIKTLAGGTCLFIYYPDHSYLATTNLAQLDEKY